MALFMINDSTVPLKALYTELDEALETLINEGTSRRKVAVAGSQYLKHQHFSDVPYLKYEVSACKCFRLTRIPINTVTIESSARKGSKIYRRRALF